MKKIIPAVLTLLVSMYAYTATAQSTSPLKDRWNSYLKCKSAAEATNFIEERNFSSIYSFVQPGSELVSQLEVVKEDVYGNSGRLFFQIQGFQIWIAFKKVNENWIMTMDENELLEKLTEKWIKTDIKGVVYVSSAPLSPEALKEADAFTKKNEELENIFGFKLPYFRYYYAKLGDEAADIVGEMDKGAGKARYRAIKAVECADHIHELVHIYAFEIGNGNPFIDEGVATTFGNKDMTNTPKKATSVLELLNEGGYEKYLDGPTFSLANMERKKVYALAQLTMTYWHNKFGMEKVKKLLHAQQDSSIDIKSYIEKNFESAAETNNQLRQILNSKMEEK